MSYDPSIFNINPYYDDFDSSKGFLRVLFKPGYALQARELTQAQTLLQNQISKIGDHLFKDGSRVLGGGISVRNSNYIMVDAGVDSPLLGSTDYQSLVGGYLRSTVSGDTTEAKIVHFISPDVSRDGKLILIVDFLSGYQYAGGFNFVKDTTTISGFTVSASALYPTAGRCKLVTVTEGIFYIDGFFVRTNTQVFAPYNNTETHRDFEMNDYADLTKKIGFYIDRDNITDKDDSTLRDPSIGSYNYNASGADRYKITPTLAQYGIEETPNDFVELLRFESGKIVRKIDRISYAEIEKTLSRRTFDESGSYSVNPFDITMKVDAGNTANFKVVVGQGKAYVLGREIENQYPVSVDLPRAQTTKLEGSPSYLSYDYTVGNYIDVKLDSFGTVFSTNLINIGSGFAYVRFHNTTNQVVATGYVHGMLPNTAAGQSDFKYRMYLYGISGSVQSGSSAMIYTTALPPSIAAVTAGRLSPNTGSVFGSVQSNDKQSLVFEMKPGYAVSEVSYARIVGKMIGGNTNFVVPSHNTTTNTTTYIVTKDHFSGSMSSPSASTFNFFNYGSGDPTNSSDTSEISIVDPNGKVFTLPSSGVTLSSVDETQFTIQVFNAPSDFRAGNLKVIAPVVYTPNIADSSTYRTKTLTTGKNHSFLSSTFSTDSTGRKFFELPDIDIFSVESIVNTTTATSYLSDFEFDDGQREATYNRGRLYVKSSVASQSRYSGQATYAVNITVTYSYFTHSGLAYAPFVGRHSYDVNYENIPLYTNPRTGKTVSLANCLDFRHSGLTSSTPMIKPYGRSEFGTLGDTEVQYQHYLPRIDKLCLRVDPEDGSPNFFLQAGTPSTSPLPPSDPQDALVLSALTVPAFTHNPEDVIITTVDTKRFTMSDIGRIQKRVEDVEVFTKLSLSENEIETRSLKTSASDTVEPLKTSIFVDEFYGHSVSDVSSDEHNCSIDFERGELRPFFSTNDIVFPPLNTAGATIDTIVSPDGIVTLNYSQKAYIENKSYTKTVKINPTNNVSWLGFMSLSETIIPRFDKSYRPIVKTNSLMENDNWLSSNTNDARGFGTQWNDWESIWYGIDDIEQEQDDIQKRVLDTPRVSSDSAIPNINSGNVRSSASRNAKPLNEKTSNYVRARQLKSRIKNKIGSKIIDRSVVPYIGDNLIQVTTHGLKPNAEGIGLFFDNVLVQSGISTDSRGSATASFSIGSGSYLIGSRTVRMSDSEDIADAEMSADAVLHCSGVLEQRSSGAYSVRPPELRRQTPSSETISKDPFVRDIDTVQNDQWADPMAQTFFVDAKTNPEGIFLKSASLYFSKKDAKIPVVVQIRPTVSGYPSPSVVVPFSTTVVFPEAITANSDSPAETVVQFSSPVYLEPGEYALCIMANSDDYELYASDTGFNTISIGDSTSGRAGNSQLVGTLFLPQGTGAAVSEPSTDLMFKLSRCEFVQQGTVNFGEVTGCIDTQIIRVGLNELIPYGCSVTRSIADYAYASGEPIYISEILGSNPTAVFVLKRGFSTAVSPVLDLQSLGGIGVKMYKTKINPVSEYVSRVVELPDAVASNGIAVFVDECTPAGSGVQVYYRYSVNGETDIFEKPWIALTRSATTPQFTATSDLDFRESGFRSTALAANTTFQSYQIKVRMTSPSNPTYDETPSARNVRTVSFFKP